MNTLTDLEINKRIAEIEGILVTEIDGELAIPDYEESIRTGYDILEEYNPLTDEAVCFDLMVKYKINITWQNFNDNCTAVIDDPDSGLAIVDVNDSCLQRAICLAVIEFNEYVR